MDSESKILALGVFRYLYNPKLNKIS